jgi:hypothetical protein
MWRDLVDKLFGTRRNETVQQPIEFAPDPVRAWRLFGEHMLNRHHGLPAVVPTLDALERAIAATGMPEGTVEDALRTAIDLSCVDYQHPYRVLYGDRAVALAAEVDRRADRWGGRWKTDSGEYGRFLVTQACARAWQQDAELDSDALRRAAEEMFRVTVEHWPGHEWMRQSLYLEAVQCLLLAGAVDEAQARLRTRRRFGATRRYFEWMCGVVSAADDERLACFDELFDRARHPRFIPLGGCTERQVEERSQGLPADFKAACRQWCYFDHGGLCLRLALLRWRWVRGRPLQGNWHPMIGQISAPGA